MGCQNRTSYSESKTLSKLNMEKDSIIGSKVRTFWEEDKKHNIKQGYYCGIVVKYHKGYRKYKVVYEELNRFIYLRYDQLLFTDSEEQIAQNESLESDSTSSTSDSYEEEIKHNKRKKKKNSNIPLFCPVPNCARSKNLCSKGWNFVSQLKSHLPTH